MTRFWPLMALFSVTVEVVSSVPTQAADPRAASTRSELAVRVAEQDSTPKIPDDAKPDDSAALAAKRQGWGNQSLENCMAMWDSGTHMTKSEWRRTCEGIQKERAPYLNK